MGIWETATDENGAVYYFNTETNETSWEKPDEMVSEVDKLLQGTDWERYETDEGQTYYYNTKTEESSWELPEEIKAKVETQGTELNKVTEDQEIDQVEEPQQDEEPDLDIQELITKYPNTSDIAKKRIVTTLTPKQLEEAKASFIELLTTKEVDSSWSFTKVMEEFIKEPLYWGLPDPLMKKEMFESYLISKSEKEYQQSLNAKELFKTNFIKVLQKYDIKYYTRWKTCSNMIVDEPIYALASEKLKKEIFLEYTKELRAEHDKELTELRNQALQELQDYLVKELKLNISSDFDKLMESLLKDRRYKENRHFEVLTKLDILTVYDSVMKSLEIDFNKLVAFHKNRNFSKDRKARKQFLNYLSTLNVKVTPKTTWFEFSSKIKDSQQFKELTGHTGSSAIDYFWDLLNTSQQFLNLQKNLILSNFLANNIKFEPSTSFDDFKSILKDGALINEMNDDELNYIYDQICKDTKAKSATPTVEDRQLRGSATPSSKRAVDSRDLSPDRVRKVADSYKTTRESTDTKSAQPETSIDNDMDY